jgi:hypothetical protein
MEKIIIQNSKFKIQNSFNRKELKVGVKIAKKKRKTYTENRAVASSAKPNTGEGTELHREKPLLIILPNLPPFRGAGGP